MDTLGDIAEYKVQLEQVEAALVAEPNSEELLKLKTDLLDIIALTEDLADLSNSKGKIESGDTETNAQEPVQKKAKLSLYDDIDIVKKTQPAKPPVQEAKTVSVPTNLIPKATTINSNKVEVIDEKERLFRQQLQELKMMTMDWKPGDECMALNPEFNQFQEAKVLINGDGFLQLKFKITGKIANVLLGNIRKIKKSRWDSNQLTLEDKKKETELREKRKKKKLSKKQKATEMEQAKEEEKKNWQSFMKANKTISKSANKKSIFASPDNYQGKIGIGTCGMGGMAPHSDEGWCLKDDVKLSSRDLLDEDLSVIGVKFLPKDQTNLTELPGPRVLQLKKIKNVSRPKHDKNDNKGNLYRVVLTDGHGVITAVNLDHVTGLSSSLLPGTKIKLVKSVEFLGGFLLLTDSNTKVLGGRVQRLIENIEKNQAISRKTKDGTGPPPLVPFTSVIKTTSLKDLAQGIKQLNIDKAPPPPALIKGAGGNSDQSLLNSYRGSGKTGKGNDPKNNNKRGGNQESRGGKQDSRGGKQDSRGGKQDSRGGRQDYRGDHQDSKGGRQNSRGGHQDSRGGRQNSRGGHQDSRGDRQDSKGGRPDSRGGRQDSRGDQDRGERYQDSRGGRQDPIKLQDGRYDNRNSGKGQHSKVSYHGNKDYSHDYHGNTKTQGRSWQGDIDQGAERSRYGRMYQDQEEYRGHEHEAPSRDHHYGNQRQRGSSCEGKYYDHHYGNRYQAGGRQSEGWSYDEYPSTGGYNHRDEQPCENYRSNRNQKSFHQEYSPQRGRGNRQQQQRGRYDNRNSERGRNDGSYYEEAFHGHSSSYDRRPYQESYRGHSERGGYHGYDRGDAYHHHNKRNDYHGDNGGSKSYRRGKK